VIDFIISVIQVITLFMHCWNQIHCLQLLLKRRIYVLLCLKKPKQYWLDNSVSSLSNV